MDTIKIITQTDSVAIDSTHSKVSLHTTIETTKIEECNSCLADICDCKLLAEWAYPLTILIIVSIYCKRIKKLIDVLIDKIQKADTIEYKDFKVSSNEKRNELS